MGWGGGGKRNDQKSLLEEAPSHSAFFIDTDSRRDKRPYFETNSMLLVAKAVLLLLSLLMVHRLLFKRHPKERSARDWRWHRQGWRRRLVFGCCVAFVGRVLLQMLLFWHRKITWVEVVAEAAGVIPLSLASLAVGASRQTSPMRPRDMAGLGLFVLGTYINVASEWQRFVFKRDPANAGRLFTGQLWRSCRHVNYFGEVLSFGGLAVPCGLWNLWIAAVMGLGMALFSVPELDYYLERKYPAEWAAYTEEVPWNMFPYVW